MNQWNMKFWAHDQNPESVAYDIIPYKKAITPVTHLKFIRQAINKHL